MFADAPDRGVARRSEIETGGEQDVPGGVVDRLSVRSADMVRELLQ
jgi:hypothetical protein